MKKIAIYIFIGIISIFLISSFFLSGWTDWKKLGLEGKLVYVGTFDQIHILDLATGRDNRLGERGDYPILLSPDSKKIAFHSYTGTTCLIIMDIATKEKEVIDKGICRPISWSPDMTKFAYWTNKFLEENYMGAMVFDLKDKKKYYMNTPSFNWSPDSKKIACGLLRKVYKYHQLFGPKSSVEDIERGKDQIVIVRNGFISSMWIRDPSSGEEREIYNAETKNFSEEADNLVFKVRDSEMDKYALIEKNNENDLKQLSIIDKKDIKKYSYSGYRYAQEEERICIIDLGNMSKQDLGQGYDPQFSSDGREIAFSKLGKPNSVWIISLESGERKKLIDGGSSPLFSPDGKKVLFFKGENIWIVDRDGNNQKQLTSIDSNKKDYRVSNPQWMENTKIIYEKWSFDTEAPMGFYYYYAVNTDGTDNQMLKKILWTAF